MARVTFDFSGTTTVVTGGASGIGFTCAELIARCGGNIIISASRSPEKTEKALAQLQKVNSKITVRSFPCEVGVEESVQGFNSQRRHFTQHRVSRSNRQRMGHGLQHQHHRCISGDEVRCTHHERQSYLG